MAPFPGGKKTKFVVSFQLRLSLVSANNDPRVSEENAGAIGANRFRTDSSISIDLATHTYTGRANEIYIVYSIRREPKVDINSQEGEGWCRENSRRI